LAGSPGYLALTEVVARPGEPDALDLLGAYFAVGEPDLLTSLFRAAGLRIDRFHTWLGATRLDSVETFVAVELLPMLDTVDPATRDRIVQDCHTALAPFVDPAGGAAARSRSTSSPRGRARRTARREHRRARTERPHAPGIF
jgi:hypothetical protein